MKISACVIAKNEEENLTVCLESLQKIADEIIVVDTGSTDNTMTIAKQLKANVYSYAWENDFAAAKNFALEKATGNWIIFLDADEYFSPETIGNVKNVIAKYAQQCDAYLLKMINIDVDNNNKHLDDFFAMRIFKNSKELRFLGKVHEELRFLNGKRKALYQVDAKEIVLYHTGYSQKRMQLKCQRNLKILLEELRENPENINLYRYLADVYNGLNDYENAVKYAKLDIETGKKEISYASRSYRVINNALLKMNASRSDIEHYLIKSIEAFPKLPDFYAEYALLKYNHQEYDEAFTLLTKAMLLNENYHDMETSLFESKMPTTYLLFGLLHEHKNDFAKAIDYYEKTLKLDKYYPEAFVSLFRLLQNQEEVYVVGFLNTIYDQQNQNDLDFLVNHIGAIQQGKVYYYYSKRNLIQKGEEKKVDSYEQLRQSMLLTLSLILINDKNKVEQLETILPLPYQNILYRYEQITDVKLSDDDFVAYKNIVLELLLTDEKETLNKYITLSTDFSKQKNLEIAQLLQERQCFVQASFLYEYLLKHDTDENAADLYFQLGFCAYQLADYTRVVACFEKALKLGYKENDVKEFLSWSVEKL
ncbi:MAG: glycosyltransferase [Firmicutes bacterium]|nr:glycosyltransferase [Bacillota bacterium]